jgi:hypothetical protein
MHNAGRESRQYPNRPLRSAAVSIMPGTARGRAKPNHMENEASVNHENQLTPNLKSPLTPAMHC